MPARVTLSPASSTPFSRKPKTSRDGYDHPARHADQQKLMAQRLPADEFPFAISPEFFGEHFARAASRP